MPEIEIIITIEEAVSDENEELIPSAKEIEKERQRKDLLKKIQNYGMFNELGEWLDEI
jgi:hypothetical protein